MSARVLNPTMMSEMSRNLGGARVAPSRAALARVRRDLFGPVDHAAARALAENEIRAQSLLDAERWGFDFRLEVPTNNGKSRYDWEIVGPQDVVPEPYALRGMPYLRKHAPPTPKKASPAVSPRITRRESTGSVSAVIGSSIFLRKSETTPPQETRVPENGESTIEDIAVTDVCFGRKRKKSCTREPTTPVLPAKAMKKQSSITDYMKSRKRTLNGTSKGSVMEPPEKVNRNAGQIRS